MAFHKIVAFIR